MAARTCLLCGKALGRFAGAGEDFCSREHRNQYRLRQGMERLAEANQVASVMRRRESPRQIPTEQLRADGNAAPREYGRAPRTELPPVRVPRLAPGSAALPGTGRFLRPMNRGKAVPQALPGAAIAISTKLRGVSVAAFLYAHVAPAPAAPPKQALANVALGPRAAIAGAKKLTPATIRPKALAASAVHFAPPKNVAGAVKGRALRVSLSAGFRLPESKRRAGSVAPVLVASMGWPEVLPIPAALAPSGDARTCAIESTPPDMRLPTAPAAAFEGNFRWPGAMPLSTHWVDAGSGHRPGFVPFGSEERR